MDNTHEDKQRMLNKNWPQAIKTIARSQVLDLKAYSLETPKKPKVLFDFARTPVIDGTTFSLIGSGGTGKSYVILYHVIKMLAKGKRVLYINAEDPKYILVERLKQIARDTCTEKIDLDDFNLVTADDLYKSGFDSLELFTLSEHSTIEQTTLFKQLCKQIKEHKINVVILDPFSFFYAAETETDNTVAARVMHGLNRAAANLNCTIGFVHHTNKHSSSNNETLDGARGSSAIRDNVRASFMIRREFNTFQLVGTKSFYECNNAESLASRRKQFYDQHNISTVGTIDCIKNNYTHTTEFIRYKIDSQGKFSLLDNVEFKRLKLAYDNAISKPKQDQIQYESDQSDSSDTLNSNFIGGD